MVGYVLGRSSGVEVHYASVLLCCGTGAWKEARVKGLVRYYAADLVKGLESAGTPGVPRVQRAGINDVGEDCNYQIWIEWGMNGTGRPLKYADSADRRPPE